jgi:antitoxin component YwqK of YwqJK toxin-antitoxin module
VLLILKMKKLFICCACLLSLYCVSAQSEVLVIHEADTFRLYHLTLNEQLSNADKKVFMYFDFPETVARVSHYLNGLQSGVEKTYYPNGDLYQTFVYANGKLWGEYCMYSAKGERVVRGNFRDDKEHGLWIDSMSGCTGKYKNGYKHGRWRCNEGALPFALYVYRNGTLSRSKK